MRNILRLANIPWHLSREDLQRYFLVELNMRVRNTRIIYNKATGLSRGIGFVEVPDSNDILAQGNLNIDGRDVSVSKYTDRRVRNAV